MKLKSLNNLFGPSTGVLFLAIIFLLFNQNQQSPLLDSSKNSVGNPTSESVGISGDININTYSEPAIRSTSPQDVTVQSIQTVSQQPTAETNFSENGYISPRKEPSNQPDANSQLKSVKSDGGISQSIGDGSNGNFQMIGDGNSIDQDIEIDNSSTDNSRTIHTEAYEEVKGDQTNVTCEGNSGITACSDSGEYNFNIEEVN